MAEASVTARVGLQRSLYAGALFIAAAGSLVLEIVAGRLLAPYVGMSLYTWTSIIAVVLTGLSLGNWIGGYLAQRDHRACLAGVVWAFALAGLFSLASLLLIRWTSGPILGAGLGPMASITVLAAALFLLPVMFAGIVAPVLTRLALDLSPESQGRVLGRMYALGALGSIAGTLATGFVFISWIGSTYTVLGVAICYFLTGILLAFDPSGSLARNRRAALLAAPVLLVGGIAFVAGALESPCRTESDYYCIRVVDYRPESGRTSAVLVLDHLGHGINDRDDPTLLYSSYTELTDRLIETRLASPERFTGFFIGGGAYTLPRAWAAKYPKSELLVAEIDPAVTRVARDALWLPESANLQILHHDARVALQDLPPVPRFDLVLGDAFHDISIPAHLATAEFAAEIAARLMPGGFYIVNVVDGAQDPRFLLSLVKTLRGSFKTVEVWGDAAQLSAGGRVTFLVVAGDKATPTGRLASHRDDGPFWVRWPGRDLAARIAAGSLPILSDDYAPVDRLLFSVLETSQ